MLIEKVKGTIGRYGMLDGGKVLVAVSGGVDSVVLLDILRRILPKERLVAAHLDHGIRGEAARADARFVSELGAQLGIRVISDRADVPGVSKAEGLSLEEAGRRVRREFLERAAEEAGAGRIALGHTRDDLVETVIFHLVRGTGPTGLSGIHPVSLPYIRPLIETTREEIVEYARERGLSWREDETNEDVRFTRNLIRHRVLPLLEELNPRAKEAIARVAALIREEEEAVDLLMTPILEDVLESAGEEDVILDRARLSTLPSAVQGLVLRRGIERARGGLTGITKAHLDALRGLIASPRAHGTLHLPRIRAYMENDRLVLGRKRREAPSFPPIEVGLGRTDVPELGISLILEPRPWDRAVGLPTAPSSEVADADRICFPLVLRTRRPGDRFQPLGMKKEKKLKDFLIDERVPFYDRGSLPLLCDQDGIIWVVGVRLSERVRITPETKNALFMRVEELS